MVASALDSCPKCGAPRTAAPACPRCGLAAERMAAFAATRDASVPDAVSAAWDAVVASWDQPARHDALFQLIVIHGAYAWGAAKYRDHQRAQPDPDPIAERQLDRLRRGAEATLLATGTAREVRTPTPYRALIAVLVALVVAIIAGLFIANGLRKPAAVQPATPHPALPGPR